MKRLAVIGSSGVIGQKVLETVRRCPDRFKVTSLVVHTNTDALLEQIKEFAPGFAGVVDEKSYNAIRNKLPKSIDSACGLDALREGLTDCDLAVIAITGFNGLISAHAALQGHIDLALANKESLVAGGELMMALKSEHNLNIFPIDSEHSAIFQCLSGEPERNIKRLILTASGGPFFDFPPGKLRTVTPAMALNHPTWNMGSKISIDSATMMNKGLEIIEAKWLFNTSNIDYVIHRESIVHSLVEMTDGSVLAQLSNPDMDIPVQYALTYPDRLPTPVPQLDLAKAGSLTFTEPDEYRFPLPALAKDCLKAGGASCCVLNAANEAAVQLFLKKEIGFLDISRLIYAALEHTEGCAAPGLMELIHINTTIKEYINKDYKTILVD